MIEDGRIAEKGTHDELIASKGRYYNPIYVSSEDLKINFSFFPFIHFFVVFIYFDQPYDQKKK